jgi:hypothetical protein
MVKINLILYLIVNPFRGRFSLRNFGLSQTYITDDPAELRQFLDDKSIEVTQIHELSEEAMMISYMRKKEWVEEHDSSNVGEWFNLQTIFI